MVVLVRITLSGIGEDVPVVGGDGILTEVRFAVEHVASVCHLEADHVLTAGALRKRTPSLSHQTSRPNSMSSPPS